MKAIEREAMNDIQYEYITLKYSYILFCVFLEIIPTSYEGTVRVQLISVNTALSSPICGPLTHMWVWSG